MLSTQVDNIAKRNMAASCMLRDVWQERCLGIGQCRVVPGERRNKQTCPEGCARGPVRHAGCSPNALCACLGSQNVGIRMTMPTAKGPSSCCKHAYGESLMQGVSQDVLNQDACSLGLFGSLRVSCWGC